MKKYLLFISVLFLTGLYSCGEDEETPPPHEAGTWNLDSYALLNLPSGFESNEGRTFALNELNLGITSYELMLHTNATYEREVEFSGQLPVDDAGAYTIDEETLTLTPDDDSDEITYGLERNRNNRLWLSVPIQFLLIEDAILDTLTQAYVDELTDEEFDALFSAVNLDLVFAFEKEE